MMTEYAHKVTVEATGPEGLYQRITFEQFYDSSEAQISEQERLFLRVANVVMDTAKEMRDENVKVEIKK
jgi:putative hemolysin